MAVKRISCGSHKVRRRGLKSIRAKILHDQNKKYAEQDQKLKQCIQEYEQCIDSEAVQPILNNIFIKFVHCSISPINQLIGQYLETAPHKKFLGMIEELTRTRRWFCKFHRKYLYDRIKYDQSIHDRLKIIIKNSYYLRKKDVGIVINNYSPQFKKWSYNPNTYENYRMNKLNVPHF